VLQSIGSDTVPEPSPLFWTHSAARVRAAIAAEPPPAGRWPPRLAWAGGGLAAAAITALLVAGQRDQAPPPVPSVVARGGELDVETASRSGLLPSGSLADRALLALDEAERSELAALLETELRRPEI
jgi:hypothetical protein